MAARVSGLSATEIAHYREHGYVVPTFRLDRNAIAALDDALARVLARNPAVRPEKLVNVHVSRPNAEGVIGDDAFLTLAHTERGLSCFLVPRVLPDGTRNPFRLQRLKDKLGNRSNASSEMEFQDTYGVMVGEDGRGVRTIMEMVTGNRIYCAISSAALMRQALVQALHHCRHRSAFQKRLAQQPLMQNVLADLAIEVEASLVLSLRVARAMDEAAGDPMAAALARLGTALAKYWNCKRAPGHIFEALECHGGPGYIEESIMPRLYREAPVNSIWEGSGNVICLDVLRAMRKGARKF